MEKKKLPMQIYVDKAAIKKDQESLENLIEVVAELATDLEREEILLDDELLDGITQEGTHAIYKKALEFGGESKAVSMMAGNLTAAANRIAGSFEKHVRRLNSAIKGSGHNQTHIRMLNGKPSLKETVLSDVREKHTYSIHDEKTLEIYEKLSEFVKGYNDLREWIRENASDMPDLFEQTEAALTGFFYDGARIDPFMSDFYLINKPNPERTDIELMVNPLFF